MLGKEAHLPEETKFVYKIMFELYADWNELKMSDLLSVPIHKHMDELKLLLREGSPNAVPTHSGVHGNPVTTQHHGTRCTGKPVESSKEHTYQGGEGREAKATNKLANGPQWSSTWVPMQAPLRACEAPHMWDHWPAGLEVNFAYKLHFATETLTKEDVTDIITAKNIMKDVLANIPRETNWVNYEPL